MYMNGKWSPVLWVIVLVVGFPRLVFGIWTLSRQSDTDETETTQQEVLTVTKINLLTDRGTVEIDIEEYLVGVLLMEIPGDFHIEAQKAQAIVARTYALRTTQYKEKHSYNAICTDPSCCQGYRDPEQYLQLGGDEERVNIARRAVDETKGQILIYLGMPIDATYFSCSGGQTEDAVAVWGVDVPYLQSVSSPGEEHADHYWDSIQFTPDEFKAALGTNLSGEANRWFGKVTYTRGGGVESMLIGGRLYAGTELRTLLGLRSTAFSVTVSDNTISITTRGFGHRVGMSQYGAQAMALNGKKYEEILAHYYLGTEIDKDRFIG